MTQFPWAATKQGSPRFTSESNQLPQILTTTEKQAGLFLHVDRPDLQSVTSDRRREIAIPGPGAFDETEQTAVALPSQASTVQSSSECSRTGFRTLRTQRSNAAKQSESTSSPIMDGAGVNQPFAK